MQRRDFLKTSALATGALMMPFSLWAKDDKINLAIVGTGWWGREILLQRALATDRFNVVGLCDVNQTALQKASEVVVKAGNPKPKLFKDYRQMYDMPELEAVVIATPTHWHALQFIAACEKGLDVFLEKPISYDIREGQKMLEAHKKALNIVTVDFPRVMFDTNEQVKAYINSGAAGEIVQAKANINHHEGLRVEKAIPNTLDYEAFCGPAPKVSYMTSPDGEAWDWRGQHAFSRGILADWGIHYIHNIRKVLDLDLPASINAIGGTVKNFSHDNPDYLDVKFDFNGKPVYWSHKTWGYTSDRPETNIGVYYYGEKATIFAGDIGWEVYPADGSATIVNGNIRFNADPSFMAKAFKAIEGLFTQFAGAIRSRSTDGIPVPLEDAYTTTAAVIYADIAFRTDSKIAINKNTMDIVNNGSAQALLKRAYRESYKHPFS
ncbi:Gfo/Idh/MocA family protein [Cesiribacter sp. SM1]|uniref:Gfo/Idh/MocA family protein n=1 Tax=Cesiribacter sp. SM1 TaxID=2861196 RepID=UPI001CD46081|nr:Gfo/Idh/MocA family oxidoreductase [Cesiribacter sp. SM1]